MSYGKEKGDITTLNRIKHRYTVYFKNDFY